jgi:hypothetical protein
MSDRSPEAKPYTASVIMLDGARTRRVDDFADLGDAIEAAERECAAEPGATGWRVRHYPSGEVVLQREVRLLLPGRVFT